MRSPFRHYWIDASIRPRSVTSTALTFTHTDKRQTCTRKHVFENIPISRLRRVQLVSCAGILTQKLPNTHNHGQDQEGSRRRREWQRSRRRRCQRQGGGQLCRQSEAREPNRQPNGVQETNQEMLQADQKR